MEYSRSRIFLLLSNGVVYAIIAGSFFCSDVEAECHPKYRQFPGHTACVEKGAGVVSGVVTSQLKSHILDLHNSFRANVTPPAADMLKLTWDDEVAMLAQRWADACDRDSTTGKLHHDHMRLIPGRYSVSQNLMMGGPDFDVAVRGWFDENQYYQFGTQISMFPTDHDIGHYTQLAWAKTYKVGCGFSTCPDGTNYWVCDYAPGGNIFPFSKPYTDGAACSGCKTSSPPYCENELCVCPGVECHVGELNPKTCLCENCGTQESFMIQADCSLNCSATDDDDYYCGTGMWTKAQCGGYSKLVNKGCPHMCNICPYADPSYSESGSPRLEGKMTSFMTSLLVEGLVYVCSMLQRHSLW